MFTPEPTTLSTTPDAPISLPDPKNPPVPPGDQINLDAPGVTKVPTEEVATVRAMKAHLALKDKSPGVEDLRSQILAGNEDQLRSNLAVGRDIADSQMRMDMVRNIAAEKAKRNEAMTDQDVQMIQHLSSDQLTSDPKTILESEYAHAYVSKLPSLTDGDNVLSKNIQNDPEATTQEMDAASNIKTRQEIVKTRLEKLEQDYNDSGTLSKAADWAGTFVPLLESVRTHNLVEGAQSSSILPGSNMDEQVQYLWALPPKQFEQAFNAAVDKLNASNPLMAQTFANKVLSFSSSDRFLDNAFAIADVATLPGIGTGAKLALKGGKVAVEAAESLRDVKVALKDAVKAEASVKPQPLEKIVEQTGDIKKSAEIGAYKDSLAQFSGQDPLAESSRLKAAVPSLFNLDRVLEGTNNLSREATDRLKASLMGNAADLLDAISGTSKVNRVTSQAAIQYGMAQAEARLKNMYSHLGDAVIDVSHVPAELHAANVDMAEMRLGKSLEAAGQKSDVPPVHLPAGSEVQTSMGKPDATLFKSRSEADYWAREIYKLNDKSYRVGTDQQGVGFYIGVRSPINETEDGFRDLQLTTDHKTPQGFMNTFLGRLRTPEDTLSTANRESRHVATHGAQELHRLAMNTAEDIGTLPKKSLGRLNEFLAANRDELNLEGGELRRGKYHENVGDFQTAWTTRFKKPPSEQETLAYFSAVQLNDWDWVVRNLGLYRDKVRQGIEKYSFKHKIVDETSGESALVDTPMIEGRQVKDIPWDDTENARVYVYDSKSHSGKILEKNGMTGTDRAEIVNKIQTEGYKVVHVANPLDKPLRKIAGDEGVVHFMVVPDVERAPLDWKQLPYRPGGHVEYQWDHWVKQPQIRKAGDKNIYEGDQGIFNFATEAEAKKYAERMETARNLLKDGKEPELSAFLERNLPYDSVEFKKLFQETQLKDGTKVPARLSLNDPIRHTSSGRNVLDAHPDIERLYPNFENQIRSSYNLYGQIDKKFASSRDATLQTVKERMGQDRPLFSLEPSKLIDPLTTMNRAMANVMRGRYLADYKIQSVENFIQEFGDLMKVEGGLKEIRKNPVYYLHNAPWDTQFPDKAKLAAGMNAQRAIISLLGSESELGSNLRWAQEGLMNAIYNKGGQKTSDYVATHLLPVTQDPFRYARNIAFHAKLGLFNPVQLVLQAQTLTHVMAVAGPRHAFPGIAGATLMRMLSLTNDAKVIDRFASMATKLGWKKEEFLESYDALKRSGLWNVEGEVAMKDDIFDPKLFNGAVGKFLDKGTYFFREGERVTRLTAWNTAYKEWKAANPERVLNNKALAEILTRQNTFSVNMTRASSAAWQQGLMSIPTQFFAYQARLAEQLLGKRLTGAEKARAFLTYSGMYGVPTAVGAATFAYPWYDDVRQAAIAHGYDVNAPGLRALIEGIPSTMIAYLTGNEQNYSQRMGPGGLQYFKDVFKDGKVDEIFGASPKILYQMGSAVAPVLKAVMSPFIPGMADYKFTSADLITAFEEISTLNNVGKAIYALNTHKFISKNEIDLGPASTADALLTSMLGTQPLRVTDAFLISEMRQEQKQMQQAVQKEVIKNYRRALKEFDQGNDQAGQTYLHNAWLQLQGGDFQPQEQTKIFKQAITGYESFLDKMNKELIKHAPQSQYWNRVNQFFKIKPIQ